MDDVILDAGQIPGGASLYDVHPPASCSGVSSSHHHHIQGTIGVPGKRTPKNHRSSPSPASTPTPNQGRNQQEKSSNGSPSPNGDPKRRRFTSSPVRPWKSPSPQPMVANELHHHSLHHHSMGSPTGGGNNPSSASNLLRHISVIRETPPVLKPQVVAPSSYHHHQIPAHHHHVPHVPHPSHHHYHHLVDPYAAAYHLYKNGTPGPSGPMTGGGVATAITGSSPAAAAAAVTAGHPAHHWGAYN